MPQTGTPTLGFGWAAFGKGRGKCHYWRIFRNGEYVDYGAIERDAWENYRRVLAGGAGHADRV